MQWSEVNIKKRCFGGAGGRLGDGRVLGCFCVRLLVSWVFVSPILVVFVGVAHTGMLLNRNGTFPF